MALNTFLLLMDSASIIEQLRDGISTSSPEATLRLAENLAAHIPPNHVLALHGDLGAGKTTFIKGIARAWQIEETVTSPTFNLYTIYDGNRQLVHLDAYRLDSSADLESLMIEDFLRPPWCLAIEWPERIPSSIPEDAWHLFLSINLESGSHEIRLED